MAYFRKRANAEAVVYSMLKQLNIKVTEETCRNCLIDHPEYPSLIALSDCLSDWKIPNYAYRISKEEYDPSELQFPFIAHMPHAQGYFLLIHEIKEQKVYFTDENKSHGIIAEQKFLDNWDGILLHAEPTAESGQENYYDALIKEFLHLIRYPALIALAALSIFYLPNTFSGDLYKVLISTLKTMGIATSILLLLHSVNANNAFIKNLCSFGKQNDCNTILNSEQAKITEWLSWSEVGFFYFSGSLLTLLFVNESVFLLSWLNLLCLPYTVYSITYQFTRRNWCVLCCTVQLLLWCEFSVFFLNGVFLPPIVLTTLFPSLICFGIPIVLWSIIKPLLQDTKQLKALKFQLKYFKYNTDNFNKLLTSQPRYAVPEELRPISIGSTDSQTIITMVSNPFCGPCALAHKNLEKWSKQRGNIKIQILFATADKEDDPRTTVSRHISALSSTYDINQIETALNDWYENAHMGYQTWAEKFPAKIDSDAYETTQRQKEWCKLVDVDHTPFILINGYKIPHLYDIEDLKYILS